MQEHFLKIKTIISLLFIFLCSLVHSQVKVQGRISDSTNTSIEFATVALKEGNLVIGSALTDQDGKFIINVAKPGDVKLHVFCVGYKNEELKINLHQDTSINVILFLNESKLREVVVTDKVSVIERKVDRLVFNVENSIATTGGDALDALKVTPGVLLNNDVITMVGKSGLKVMINDKPVQLSGDELTNFLRSISVTNISKIEVITNPSASYDAEGNSGLINIKLKTARNNTWNSTINGAYTKTTYSTGRGGANFNYQKNKISFYSNVGVSDGSRKITDRATQHYQNQLLSTIAPRKVSIASLTGAYGVSYSISKKWNIGTQYIGSVSELQIANRSSTTLYDVNNLLDSTLKTNSQSTDNSQNHSFNANASVDIDTTGKKIVLNIDYFIYKSNTDGKLQNNTFYPDETISPTSYFSVHNISKLGTQNYSGKIDIENPFKKFSLYYGGKISETKTDNDLTFYNTTTGSSVFDHNISNIFRYIEHNFAIYISGYKKINKLDIKLGLRGENTETKGTSVTLNKTNNYSYFKIFPTAYFLYTSNKNNSFLLNYGRRINRPNYEQLNPFRIYVNPYSYVEGNPFLKPSFSDNVEFIYRFKELESKLFYSNTQNGFKQLSIIDPNSISQRTIVENFFTTNLYGVFETFIYNKISWLNSNNSFAIYYSSSKSSSPVTNNKLASFNSFFSTSNDVTLSLSKSIYINFTYAFNFPGSSNLSKTTAFNQLDISIKALFLKKSLSLAVTGQDVFSSNRPTSIQYSNGIKSEYRNYYDNRYARISLSYKFGNKKINVSQKEFGNADEKSRTINK